MTPQGGGTEDLRSMLRGVGGVLVLAAGILLLGTLVAFISTLLATVLR
jgi:hypothetical protein